MLSPGVLRIRLRTRYLFLTVLVGLSLYLFISHGYNKFSSFNDSNISKTDELPSSLSFSDLLKDFKLLNFESKNSNYKTDEENKNKDNLSDNFNNDNEQKTILNNDNDNDNILIDDENNEDLIGEEEITLAIQNAKELKTPKYSKQDINKIIKKKSSDPKESILVHERNPKAGKANATLLSIVRNNELNQLLMTMDEVEATFNSKFKYPWTLLNDEPFTKEFKDQVKKRTLAKVNFELIPKNHWDPPEWIDLKKATERGHYMKNVEEVQYSDLLSYHNMCRWNSGVFYNHPSLLNYRWYWRIEPNTHYYCDTDYDLFWFMEDNDKTYGFNIVLYDSPQSVRNLWPTTVKFLKKNPQYLHENNALGFIVDDSRPEMNKLTNGYSTCHFWSNFEIGDMDFWRSEPYSKYFEYLDKSGGFYYERWGDAPVHSLGLSLFEDKNKLHWFKDIGYRHIPFLNCPNSDKCKGCEPGTLFEGDAKVLEKEVCLNHWWEYAHMN